MVSLLDIALTAVVVEIDGAKIDVPGISAAGIVSLLQRFPELRDQLSGGRLNVTALSPQIMAAIIAAGCGNPGDEKAEQCAAQFSLQAQVDLLDAILRRTLPKGVGPFVASINRLMAGLSDPVELAKAKLEQMKASPKASKPLSDGAGIRHEMSGP